MNSEISKENDEWFTTEEAANYLKISVASLRNMTSNGHVPYYKLQRRNRYLKSELHKMLISEKRGPGALDDYQANNLTANYGSNSSASRRRSAYRN